MGILKCTSAATWTSPILLITAHVKKKEEVSPLPASQGWEAAGPKFNSKLCIDHLCTYTTYTLYCVDSSSDYKKRILSSVISIEVKPLSVDLSQENQDRDHDTFSHQALVKHRH